MATDDKIRDEKLLINREVAKRSTLSSGKINKYILHVKKHYHLIKEEWIQQAEFTYSPLEKDLEK